MARAHYYVVPHLGSWAVKHNDLYYPFITQKDAIRSAVDAAHVSGQRGFDAQVLVQGVGGQFRTEWTYGHDPYPPAG
jgi:hypothetical protein